MNEGPKHDHDLVATAREWHEIEAKIAKEELPDELLDESEELLQGICRLPARSWKGVSIKVQLAQHLVGKHLQEEALNVLASLDRDILEARPYVPGPGKLA